MASNYSETHNTTSYPLNGGIKTPQTTYSGDNSVEFEKMARLIEELKEQIKQLQNENEHLKDTCFKYKERGDEFLLLLQSALGNKVVPTSRP